MSKEFWRRIEDKFEHCIHRIAGTSYKAEWEQQNEDFDILFSEQDNVTKKLHSQLNKIQKEFDKFKQVSKKMNHNLASSKGGLIAQVNRLQKENQKLKEENKKYQN